MATKVHLVKKSRTDNEAVKRGESYYWWKLPFGNKTCSAAYPGRSQLTNSDYLGCVFDLQDSLSDFTIDDASDFEAMIEEVSDVIADIQEQCQTNLDNMVPNLHVAPNGRLLVARLAILGEVQAELDALDYDDHVPGTEFEYAAFAALLKKLEVTRVGKVIQHYGSNL